MASCPIGSPSCVGGGGVCGVAIGRLGALLVGTFVGSRISGVRRGRFRLDGVAGPGVGEFPRCRFEGVMNFDLFPNLEGVFEPCVAVPLAERGGNLSEKVQVSGTTMRT